MNIQQCGDNKLHNSRNKCSFTWFTLQGWQTWSISNELHIKIWPPLSKWITLLLTFSPRLLLYLYFCISSSVHNTYMYVLRHTNRSKRTPVSIYSWQGVSGSRWRALCHMLNHPSVAAYLYQVHSIPIQRGWKKLALCSSVGTESTTLARREITAKTSDKDGLWSNRTTDSFAGFSYSFFPGSVKEQMFISSHYCFCLFTKKRQTKAKYGHNCRIRRLEYIVLVWCQQTVHTPIDQSSKQLYF